MLRYKLSSCVFLKITSLPAACNNLVYEVDVFRIRKKKHVWRHMRDMHSEESFYSFFFFHSFIMSITE